MTCPLWWEKHGHPPARCLVVSTLHPEPPPAENQTSHPLHRGTSDASFKAKVKYPSLSKLFSTPSQSESRPGASHSAWRVTHLWEAAQLLVSLRVALAHEVPEARSPAVSQPCVRERRELGRCSMNSWCDGCWSGRWDRASLSESPLVPADCQDTASEAAPPSLTSPLCNMHF